MAQIARLKDAEISNGNIINADDLDSEFNQLVSESNGQDTRLTTIESGAFNKSGVMTFLTTPKTDAISEVTAGVGVTIDGVVCKDSMVTVAGTPTTNGQIGYASNVLNAYINGGLKTIATTDAITTTFEYLGTSGAISAAATVSFTTAAWFASTYQTLIFKLVRVKPANDGVNFYMLASVDGGSNYLGASSYDYINSGRNTADAAKTLSAATQAQIIPHTSDTIGSDTNEWISGHINLENAFATTYKDVKWATSHQGTGNVMQSSIGDGRVLTTTAINAIQFKMSAGNIASGEIKVYGVRAS